MGIFNGETSGLREIFCSKGLGSRLGDAPTSVGKSGSGGGWNFGMFSGEFDDESGVCDVAPVLLALGVAGPPKLRWGICRA